MASDPASADLADACARARSRLGRLAGPFLYFSTIGSTNDVARQCTADAGAEGTVVVADAQTSGRGRRGRRWFSPAGSGLYVSVVLRPGQARADGDRATRLLTLAAGVAMAEGIEVAVGVSPQIKWPNDLLLGRRKVGGILAEAIGVAGGGLGGASVVLGYGINVGAAAYPPEIADRATALEPEVGQSIDRARLLVETLAALSRRYDDLLAGRFDAILDAWTVRAPMCRGASVRWETGEGPRAGTTAGVDGDGALLARTDEGLARLLAGEVTWA